MSIKGCTISSTFMKKLSRQEPFLYPALALPELDPTIDILSCCSRTTIPTMASYNDSYLLPRQPGPSYPISIVDIFFPGFTNISAAIQQLQVGNSNGYARILCICGIVVFLGKYAFKYLRELVTTYFSSWLLTSGGIF
jgi:hypothetical protein